MLSTLLNSLASSFSKFFILASWLPVLVFAFFNGLMGFLLFESFHDWAIAFIDKQTVTAVVFVTATIIIGTVVAAYVLSSLNDFLRGLLEGRWPEALRRISTSGQARRLSRLQRRIADANRVRLDLEESNDTWLELLVDARVIGQGTTVNSFTRRDTAAKKIQALEWNQIRGGLIDSRDIRGAVDDLLPSLRTNNAELRDTRDRWSLGDA